MTCDEGRLVAFLNGQLSDDDEHAFDEHLLACDSCWRAVRDDRYGRRAVDQLRRPAPEGLAERVAASIRFAEGAAEPGGTPTGGGRRPTGRVEPHRTRDPRRLGRRVPRRPRLLAGFAAAAALLGGLLAWDRQHGAGGDPAQIARVVAMLSPGVADQPALRAGERFYFAGQAVAVRSYTVEGEVVLVATSPTPFPTPSRPYMLSGSASAAWMAAEGRVAMYGLNRPASSGRESMFLAAAMPAAELPKVAASLKLI